MSGTVNLAFIMVAFGDSNVEEEEKAGKFKYPG